MFEKLCELFHRLSSLHKARLIPFLKIIVYKMEFKNHSSIRTNLVSAGMSKIFLYIEYILFHFNFIYLGPCCHRLPARSSSEPDLPRKSENNTILLIKPQHRHVDKREQNFVIQGRTVLPHIEPSPSRVTSSYTRKTGSSCVPQLRLSSPYKDESENVGFPPLSARQCFPSQKPQIISNSKDEKKRIKPMKRNTNFNKYFQSRFGRNLEQSSDDVLNTLNRVNNQNWGLNGRELTTNPEQRRIAIRKVVEQIFRPQKDYENKANELDKVLEESFQCRGFKSL